MLRKLLIATLLAAAVAAPAGAVPRQLMPGVTLDDQVRFTLHGPVVVHVLTAPRPGGLWELQPVLSNETITGTEKLTAIEKRLSPALTAAGVNGDLFTPADGHPSGMLMRGGVLDHDPIDSRSSIGIDSQGGLHVNRVALFGTWQGSGPRRAINAVNDPAAANTVSLFTPAYGPATPPAPGAVEIVLSSFPAPAPNVELQGTATAIAQNGGTPIPAGGAVLTGRGTAGQRLTAEAPAGRTVKVRLILKPDWTGVVGAIGGGPALVRNGRPVFRANEAFTTDQLLPREARTAVGQLADGRIVLVAVDGGQPGYSTGMTNFELAQTLAGLHAVTAAALGFGAQAAMAVDGQLVGRFADPAVAEALLVTYAGVYAPPPLLPVLSPNGDGVAEKQTLAYKVVRPSNVSVSLLGPDGVPRYTTSGQVAPGTYSLDWPGLKPDGTPEAEGLWRWVVTAADDLGRSSAVERRFSLNDTLGFAKPVGGLLAVPRPSPRPVASFTLTHAATVTTRIETPSGVVVATIDHRKQDPGVVEVAWDGVTDTGAIVYSGRYVARASASNQFGTVDLTSQFAVRRVAGRG